MEAKNGKKQYPTRAQKMQLVGFLEADEELRQSKFSASFTKKVAEDRWKQIAENVNSIPGAKKEWQDWRKCWQDMKSKTKKKNTELRKCQNGTGGGPPAPSLSDIEEGILNTMSQPVLTGHADSQESVVNFKDITFIPSKIDVPPAAATSEVNLLEGNNTEEEGKGCDTQIIIEIEQEEEITKADNKENKRKTKKNKPQKRLQQSLQVASDLKKALIEKNSYKKIFYERYIQEMQRQTDALLKIAENLNKTKSTDV